MADVDISFGAKLEELLTGVDTAKEAVAGMAETLGIGLSIAGIAEFISQMEELGEQTTRTAAMLGTTTTEAQKLGIEAKLAGGSSEGLAIALERMQVNLATAGNESGRAGQALKVLGLSAKDLVGIPIPEQMNRIADAVSHFADSGTKTAAVMALMGRSGAQMIPLLDEGSKGFEEFNQRMEEAGAVVGPKTIAKLTELRENFTLLKASFVGLGEDLVASLVPASTAFVGLIADIHQLVGADGAVLWRRAMLDIQTGAQQLGLELLRLGVIAKDVFTLNWGEIATHWNNGAKLIEDNLKEWSVKVAAIMDPVKEKMRDALAGTVGGAGLPTVPAMQIGRGAGASDAKALADEQIKALELVAKTNEDAAAAKLKLGQITETEYTRIVIDEINKRESAQLAALNKEEASGELNAKQREAVEAKKTQIVMQAALERQKATEKEAEAEKAAMDKAANAILSAWNSQLRSVLDGSESFSVAMQKTFGDLVIKLIEMIEEVIAKMLVLLAFEAITGTGSTSVGAAFAGAVGKVFGFKEGAWSVGSGQKFPSYEYGTPSIPGTQVALLHQGEMVVPSSPAQTIRDALSTGGATGAGSAAVTFSLQAWDGASVQTWLRGGGAQQIARAVAQAMNSNPTLRPSY